MDRRYYDILEARVATDGQRIRRFTVVVDDKGRLREVHLQPRHPRHASRNGPRCRQAVRQVAEYLKGHRRRFDLPWGLPRDTTPFTRQVLRVVGRIPYGATCTYGAVAARAGHPGAARAVGRAMASNPLPLFIPCHRVVAAGGGLGGFGGGLPLKRALLALERANV